MHYLSAQTFLWIYSIVICNLNNKYQSSNYLLSSNVINLSERALNENEISILDKGLNFCPTPGETCMKDIHNDLDNFFKRIRNKVKYHKEFDLNTTDPN